MNLAIQVALWARRLRSKVRDPSYYLDEEGDVLSTEDGEPLVSEVYLDVR